MNHWHEIQEFQILFVQCKRPELEIPVGWDAACTQLSNHFKSNVNDRNRMYGAIDIGTRAVF